jgi:hypothetical protein
MTTLPRAVAAGVQKAPRHEVAGSWAPVVQRALWGFDGGASAAEVERTLLVQSKMLAGNAGVSADEAAEEWAANVVPGITIIPSGTWGVNRAQEADFNRDVPNRKRRCYQRRSLFKPSW